MSEPSSILAECRSYPETACTHLHPYGQLILPLAGTLRIETAAHAFELDTSRLFFLPPDCRHTFYAQDPNRFLVLDIPSALLPRPANNPAGEGVAAPLDERWQALRFLMLAESERSAPANPALSHLFQYAYYNLLPPKASPRSLHYLQEHFREAVDLPTLAALEGFHPTYYSEWFKRETGLTVTAYLHHLRLAEAKKLLQHTGLSLLRIAQEVGYEHHASLTRLFHQYEKLTPSAYRRHSRKSAKKG